VVRKSGLKYNPYGFQLLGNLKVLRDVKSTETRLVPMVSRWIPKANPVQGKAMGTQGAKTFQYMGAGWAWAMELGV